MVFAQEERLTATERALATFAPITLLVLSSSPSALHARPFPKSSERAVRMQTRLDVLQIEKFAPLHGKHIGLITNHTRADAEGRRNIDLLAKAPDVTLIALFSPEHGLAGHADERVASSKNPTTSLPIYSLYGDT